MRQVIRKAIPIIKWIISGGIAVLLDLAVLFTLVEFFHVHYLVAASVGFALSATTNFTISRLAIFQDAQHSLPRSYTTFMAISIIGLGALNLGMFLLVDVVGLHYLISRIVLAGTLGVSSFFLHKYFSFKSLSKM